MRNYLAVLALSLKNLLDRPIGRSQLLCCLTFFSPFDGSVRPVEVLIYFLTSPMKVAQKKPAVCLALLFVPRILLFA